ncbi:MAG: serine protease [Nitrospinota bacterium]
MFKTIGGFILLGVLLTVLFLNTHFTLLGSGFLIGDGKHVFTYANLIKEADVITVKFPNEDDILAEVLLIDPSSNLAILELQNKVKVKRQPLNISPNGLGSKSETVFTLGYPWTNTLQDQHVLIEGSAIQAPLLIDLNMEIEPVHSGSPVFNSKHEIVGMVLMDSHAKSIFPVEGTHPYAIPARLLKNTLKKAKIDATPHQKENLTREAFISKSRNNVVLIEAR